jgi:hypothetical protein
MCALIQNTRNSLTFALVKLLSFEAPLLKKNFSYH